ncbi:CRISPR-associated endonuclease Cas1 [Candidatus Poriferisodalis sp.]|uniref:CRISPR-associated endonuclease Cas4g/Cas1g n=1 Tax=Candidatus Poriferisodalis sp. TaxID=3101277 RepID=UPI003B024D60
MTEVPDLVPARMVNEFVYCPRLFYLEWVQSRFEDNADTVHGRYVHRRVDEGGGRMGGSSEDDPVSNARSVLVSSERLGLIAKTDIVEGFDGRVVPVEVKRGRPPNHGPAWEPELQQLATIGLILRDSGYDCDEGQFYFAASRERTTVEFDDRLLGKTLDTVERLRRVAAADDAPPPLVDSPKCPRCSLVGICLPDETNFHTGRVEGTPRRLTPRDSEARPLYVTEQGARLGISQRRVEVKVNREVVRSDRLIDISQINLSGNVQVSTQLLHAAFREDIPVCWFSYGGWFQGIAHGMPSKHVELRRRQVAVAAQAGLPLARQMIVGKIRNSRTLLMRNSREPVDAAVGQLKELATKAAEVDSVESLLGTEGAAARSYFGSFASMLKDDRLGTFDFAGRNRRPPRDPVNCLLSFLYALLVKDVTAVVYSIGFDPYLGVYHRPRFGRPALALDLAEEFRPIIAESVVINAVNNGEVAENGFVVRAGGVALEQAPRRAVIASYERRLDHEITHPTYGYKITYRRVLEVQARMLAAAMLGEIPEYVPFTTR